MSQIQICDHFIFRSHDYVFFLVFLAKDKCHKHPTKKWECHQSMALFTQTAKGLRWRAEFGSDKQFFYNMPMFVFYV